MTVQIPSLVFSLTILLFTVLDAKRLKTIITPFSVAAWPFAIISLVTNFLLGYLKFPPMTMRVHLFILLNLTIVWLVGYIFSQAYRIKGTDIITVDIKSIFQPFVRYQYFLMILSLILSMVIFIRVYSLMNQFGGWWFFGDERFEEMMIIGPVAHLIQVAKVCFLLLFFIYPHSKRKLFLIITLSALLVAIALIQVKYHLIWLMIIGFLYVNMPKKLSGQLKGVATISLLVFLMMNVFWISLTFAWGTFSFKNDSIREFLLNNSINYFVSGPILLDKWLDWPFSRPDWVLLTVFQNISYVLMGIPIRVDFIPLISHGFLETAPGITSNVGTSMGLYYMIGGYPFTLFMTTLMSVLSYLFYFKAIRVKSPIWIFLNFIFLTMMMMSFYGQYFTTITPFEMTIIFMLFIYIFNFLNWGKEKKTT
jgi:oligosaccharide repeat unit polymerase